DANAMAEVGLEIEVGRRSDERDDLAPVIDERKLGSAWPARHNWPQDADGVVLDAGDRCGDTTWLRCGRWLAGLSNVRRRRVGTTADFRVSFSLVLRCAT